MREVISFEVSCHCAAGIEIRPALFINHSMCHGEFALSANLILGLYVLLGINMKPSAVATNPLHVRFRNVTQATHIMFARTESLTSRSQEIN